MPIVARKGDALTIDLSDLRYARMLPWSLLEGQGDARPDLPTLRENLFEFLDLLEAQWLAYRREMCMNVRDGRVCNARSAYVVDRHIYLCEDCWNDHADEPARPVDNKIEL